LPFPSLVKLTYKRPMTQPSEIGARIKDARRKHGWTQDDLAEAVGVSRSAVAQWETGRAGQLTPNLTRIASVLGVGVEFLTLGEDKRGPVQTKSADELAIVRLYRECAPEDRQILLRMARRLAMGKTSSG
jgi:transcriptional regulator with XRE-family HTH domain